MEHPDQEINAQYLWDRRSALRLRAVFNRVYQQQRQRIMEMREGLVKVCSLIGGSVALANIANPQVIAIAAACIFAGSAASLVFGWGSKARDAGRRVCEWISLEGAIEAAGERDFTEVQLNQWAARCNEIEASEPAMNKVLMEKSYKSACASIGVSPPPGPTYFGPAVFIP